MGLIEYAAKLKPTLRRAKPRHRTGQPFTLVEERGSLLQHQQARTGLGEAVLVKFTPEAASMWKRLKAAGKTPRAVSYGANYAPARTSANPDREAGDHGDARSGAVGAADLRFLRSWPVDRTFLPPISLSVKITAEINTPRTVSHRWPSRPPKCPVGHPAGHFRCR